MAGQQLTTEVTAFNFLPKYPRFKQGFHFRLTPLRTMSEMNFARGTAVQHRFVNAIPIGKEKFDNVH